MGLLILAIGLVLCVEGLVFALAPVRLEDILRSLAEIPPAVRRMFGLTALALGVGLVAWGRSLTGL